MLRQFLASLSQKDRTVALILALCIGIGILYKNYSSKDDAVVQNLQNEIAQLRTEKVADKAEIARLNTKNLTIQAEFLNDLKEQRGIIQGIDQKQSSLSRSVQKAQKVNTKKLDSTLKNVISP